MKGWVWEIRERESDCCLHSDCTCARTTGTSKYKCGQKIQYFLKHEHRLKLSVTKIYEILSEKYVIRPDWQKNKVRGPIPKASMPREVVQMDSIDFGALYAFTGVDIFTREADILIAPELTARFGREFLYQSMGRRFNGHVQLIQTDGGPEFKAEFLEDVSFFCDRHRTARPYRKNEQSYIESFNRTVRKECLGWQKYRREQIGYCQGLVEEFLKRYHYHRPHLYLLVPVVRAQVQSECKHISLNMSPPLSK